MAVKFEIYRDGGRVMSFQPVAAMVMGPESIPIVGTIRFQDGLLWVESGDDHAVGVSLLWDLGVLGAYVMETTRLPHREEPYNLNVELARQRLMKLVQKQEDWNLFDFPSAESLQSQFRETQAQLAEALGHLDEPVVAADLADQVLQSAVALSDSMTQFHAELLLNRRRSTSQFARHIFGCRVDSTIQAEKYRQQLVSSFDFASLPIPWHQVEPQEDTFETAAVDQWVEALNRQRMPVIAGPLIRLSEMDLPDWMAMWEHDFDALRDHAYRYVQKMVYRYRRGVTVWNVVAGLNASSNFLLTFEQRVELTRLLISQVKTLVPGARTLVTISQPFGEYQSHSARGVPPLLYAEMIAQAGINFEGFGVELLMGTPAPGQYVRDLFQISSLLDRFSSLGKPVFLTAVGVPSRGSADPGDKSEGKLDPSVAGRWRHSWDPQLQAEWVEAIYNLALSKPYVESITWSNLADLEHTLPGGGLLTDMLQPKPAFGKIQQLRQRYRQWQRK